MKRMIGDIGILLLFVGLVYTCMFYVNEDEHIVITQLGKPVASYSEPGGPHFKLPWPIQSATSVDKRWKVYHSSPKEIITKDKKTIKVAIFALFRVTDPIVYIQNTQSFNNAQTRMDEIVYSEMHNRIGAMEFEEVVTTRRAEIMNEVHAVADVRTKQYGLESGLVRMNEVDLPEENRKSVFSRMSEERMRQAKLYKAEGAETAMVIKAETDKEANVIRSVAKSESIETYGRADAEAAAILNGAYGQGPEFFRLLASLDAAKTIFAGSNVNLVLNGKEEHLKYLLGENK